MSTTLIKSSRYRDDSSAAVAAEESARSHGPAVHRAARGPLVAERRGRLVVEPNETIDQAQDLGTLSQPVERLGSIGNGPDGAADVTWYHFNLADSARVDLELSTPAGNAPFASVLSLYNNDPQDYSDPYDLGRPSPAGPGRGEPVGRGRRVRPGPRTGRLFRGHQRRRESRLLPGDRRERVRRGDRKL